ncbi:unnamed protein product [Ectocarpus fasciculatus]
MATFDRVTHDGVAAFHRRQGGLYLYCTSTKRWACCDFHPFFHHTYIRCSRTHFFLYPLNTHEKVSSCKQNIRHHTCTLSSENGRGQNVKHVAARCLRILVHLQPSSTIQNRLLYAWCGSRSTCQEASQSHPNQPTLYAYTTGKGKPPKHSSSTPTFQTGGKNSRALLSFATLHLPAHYAHYTSSYSPQHEERRQGVTTHKTSINLWFVAIIRRWCSNDQHRQSRVSNTTNLKPTIHVSGKSPSAVYTPQR